MRLAGSIAIHALLVLLFVALVHRTDAPPGARVEIELVDVAVARAPARAPSAPGGAAPAAPVRPAPRRAARSMTAPTRSSTTELEELHGRAVVEERAGGDGTGGGDGAGTGTGSGSGLGFGGGHRLADLVPVAPPVPAPPLPRVSKARPPVLVYPSRQTAVEDAALFVAEVTVDTDGFVAGARLVRGFGGPRDAEAAGAIWRFRYDPALDDEGLPIQSTVQQKFAVAR